MQACAFLKEALKGRGWKGEVAVDRTSESKVLEEVEDKGIGMSDGC